MAGAMENNGGESLSAEASMVKKAFDFILD